MKIKSIILAAVLATTMTGCAELNNTLSVLAQQAEIYRNGTSSNSLFTSLYRAENKEYCQEYYFCQKEGKGFDKFAYRVHGGLIDDEKQESVSFHIGNNIAKLGWLAQKCYEDTPNHSFCDRKYYGKIDEIMKKAGGKYQFDKQVITTDI